MASSLKLALVVGLMAFLAATASASPKTLLAALAKAYPTSQLPRGFSAARVSRGIASLAALNHHAFGEIAITIKGPDPSDFIFYVVFGKQVDARADLADARLGGHSHLVGKVPGYTKSLSRWFTGSETRQNAQKKNVTRGLTGMFVVDGTVLVAVVTDSKHKGSGNVPGALALLKSALGHLHAVEAKLG